MKHIVIALAIVAATSASAQQPSAAEAARRDTDPAVNGHVRDVQAPDATQAAAVAARRDTDPAVNGTPSSTKPPTKPKTVAKR